MTQYLLRTSLEEADAIISGDQRFLFRDTKYKYGKGDLITFQAYKNGHSTRHPIEKKMYKVTCSFAEAPVEKGFRIIGFKEV